MSHKFVALAVGCVVAATVATVFILVTPSSSKTATCYESLASFKAGVPGVAVTVRNSGAAAGACEALWSNGDLNDGVVGDPAQLRLRVLQVCTARDGRIVVFPRVNTSCRALGFVR